MVAQRKIKPRVLDVFLIAAFFVSTGVIWQSIAAKGRPVERLEVRPEQVELGEVDQVQRVPFVCQLENLGIRDAIISEVTLPCTCTNLDLPTGTTLSPGSRRRVRGNVDTRSRRGGFEITIPVTYQAPESVEKYVVLIRLKMFVRPWIASSEETIVIRENSWAPLVLTARPNQSFRISAIEPSDPYVRWEVIGAGLGKESSEFRLRFTFDGSLVHDSTSLSAGSHWVDFTTTSSNEPTFRLPVTFGNSEKKAR
jgi:hypothetical protein